MIYYIALCNMCKLLLIAIIVIDLVIAMCYILVEVINMDNALRFLTDAALGSMREELTYDADYRQCQAEGEALWAQLRQRYQGEMGHALLAAADAENALAGFETERAFLIGLQLGISMGRLDLLPEK